MTPSTTFSVLLSFFTLSRAFLSPFSQEYTLSSRQESTTSSGSPVANPPYQLSSILSTPTTINFLFNDPNVKAPPLDGGKEALIRCSLNLATPYGQSGSPQVSYDPQTCVDTVTGRAESTSTFSWQILKYTEPGLFAMKVWHGYIDKSTGPCAVQEDGTETFCDVIFYGTHQVDADQGDVTCDTAGLTCTSEGVIEVPITSAVA